MNRWKTPWQQFSEWSAEQEPPNPFMYHFAVKGWPFSSKNYASINLGTECNMAYRESVCCWHCSHPRGPHGRAHSAHQREPSIYKFCEKRLSYFCFCRNRTILWDRKFFQSLDCQLCKSRTVFQLEHKRIIVEEGQHHRGPTTSTRWSKRQSSQNWQIFDIPLSFDLNSGLTTTTTLAFFPTPFFVDRSGRQEGRIQQILGSDIAVKNWFEL